MRHSLNITEASLKAGELAMSKPTKDIHETLVRNNTSLIPDTPRGGDPVQMTEEERQRADALKRFLAIVDRDIADRTNPPRGTWLHVHDILKAWLKEVGEGAELLRVDPHDIFYAMK